MHNKLTLSLPYNIISNSQKYVSSHYCFTRASVKRKGVVTTFKKQLWYSSFVMNLTRELVQAERRI